MVLPVEDVPTAFLRHATSKIRKQDDLEAIGTFGFVGRHSVAAVANVEVRPEQQMNYLQVRFGAISGGEQQACEDYMVVRKVQQSL